jgi:hypothetical protein
MSLVSPARVAGDSLLGSSKAWACTKATSEGRLLSVEAGEGEHRRVRESR